MNLWSSVLAVAATLFLSTRSVYAEPRLSVEEPWSNLFAGQQAAFTVRLSGVDEGSFRVGWRLSADQATVARGEQSLSEAASLVLDMPPVKPGVVVPLVLRLELMSGREAVAVEKRLWVFPEDPFEGRSAWLEGLGIHLFDPEGDTAALFEEHDIPFTALRSAEALAGVDEGLVIVGEGVSFDAYRALMLAMTEVASKGIPVLCLAPSGGSPEWPGRADADLPKPSALRFAGREVVPELDKRLDPDNWVSAGRTIRSSFALTAHRQAVVVDVQEGGAAWPWMEIDYATNKGKLVLIGWAIIEQWETGPAPRFLFARLLEWMQPKQEESK